MPNKPVNKGKQAPSTLTISQNSSSTDTNNTLNSTNAEQQFEIELCWCIQQLQTALNCGKLNSRQVQDHTKSLNTLMSKSAPLVKKRQVMRLSFGDYRAKMAAEDKKLSKNNLQLRLSLGKPSKKSVFLRKSVNKSSDNSFKFNFQIPRNEEIADYQNENTDNKVKTENQRKENSFNFQPSDNSFRFSFECKNNSEI